MARRYSIEDGNLSTATLVSSRQISYKDIDLTFQNRPSGDIYKKTEAAAVKQSVKNLLMTNRFEKPFDPSYGGGLNEFLFSLDQEFDELDIQERVRSVVANYEPRAVVNKVNVELAPDQHTVGITVVFSIRTTGEVVELDVSLTRVR